MVMHLMKQEPAQGGSFDSSSRREQEGQLDVGSKILDRAKLATSSRECSCSRYHVFHMRPTPPSSMQPCHVGASIFKQFVRQEGTNAITTLCNESGPPL